MTVNNTETAKLVIRSAFDFFTSSGMAIGVVIGGILCNNTLYYRTGLSTTDVPLIIPCVLFLIWSFMMSFIDVHTDWGINDG